MPEPLYEGLVSVRYYVASHLKSSRGEAGAAGSNKLYSPLFVFPLL